MVPAPYPAPVFCIEPQRRRSLRSAPAELRTRLDKYFRRPALLVQLRSV